MEMSGQVYDSAALPAGKESRYPLDRKLGGLQSRYWSVSEEKNSHLLPGHESRSSST